MAKFLKICRINFQKSMETITVKDKKFKLSIDSQTIQNSIKKIADKINADYASKDIFFIGILNGSFMFAADLIKNITVDCTVSFTKLATYDGTHSTGVVKELIGLKENIENKHVVIIEDIVDTGFTMKSVLAQLSEKNPADIKIATLLFKPQSFKENFKVDYVCLEIPNDFIVGYGLDYDGYGRNYKSIYTVVNN